MHCNYVRTKYHSSASWPLWYASLNFALAAKLPNSHGELDHYRDGLDQPRGELDHSRGGLDPYHGLLTQLCITLTPRSSQLLLPVDLPKNPQTVLIKLSLDCTDQTILGLY